jgi:DNA-binding CsgD family transcriptional regulator
MTIEPARDEDRLARISAALQHGIVVVDANGAIVWMDRTARRRVDGELRNLALPLARSEADSLDCFVSPVDLTINGENVTLGVIQEADAQKRGPDLFAAIESVLADSTSWFTRTVMEKLRTVSEGRNTDQMAPPASNGTVQLDMLSAREREVLELICEGMSDVQMAAMLGLSENTVRNHIAALYRKIGVNRRTAAVIWARERGITGRDGLRAGRAVRRVGTGNGNGRTLPY